MQERRKNVAKTETGLFLQGYKFIPNFTMPVDLGYLTCEVELYAL
jgi:hypothetical protein